MKKIKKINHIILVLILSCASISGLYCTGTIGKKSGETRMNVTVDNITSNDLGQVLIFGTSDGNRKMFVKSFYTPEKKQETIQTDIRKYLKEISPIKGKQVIIYYRNNKIGDMEILEIEE
jgi:hypothetical protein